MMTTRRKLLDLFALAACLALPASAVAQTPAQRPTPAQSQAPTQNQTPARDASAQAGAEPDLSITARVTARELRFEKVPNPKVEFTGKPRRETAWEAERENLPGQVQPGVTYRDIGIRLRITSVFADIERIVAEALGEIPLSDDAPAAPAPPASSTPATPAPSSQTSPTPPSTPADAARPSAQQTSPAPTAARDARAKRRTKAARKGRGM